MSPREDPGGDSTGLSPAVPASLGSLRVEVPLLPGNELSNGWTWYSNLLAPRSHKDSAQPPTRCMVSGKSSDPLSLSFLRDIIRASSSQGHNREGETRSEHSTNQREGDVWDLASYTRFCIS